MSADAFWIDAVRKCGSNGATDGFGSLEDLINSKRLTPSQLRSLHSALRSLSHLAWDTAAEIENRAKRPWQYQERANG